MKVVIIHGTFGHPGENRFPWLKQKLEIQGHEVRIPKLPTPENQTPSNREIELKKQIPFVFDQDTILIGHSLGATFLLHILDRDRKEPVPKAILVSGFTHKLGNEKFDTLNEPFIEKDFNREKIRKNSNETIIFHGDNDPYVPVSEAQNLHQNLGGVLNIISGGGHLNAESGYQRFEELLKYL